MKNFIANLTEKDLQGFENLVNNFPLGKVTVGEAQAAQSHAQAMLDFIGSKLVEVEENGNGVPDADKKKGLPDKN